MTDPLCLCGLYNLFKQPRFSLYLLYKERRGREEVGLGWTIPTQPQAEISRKLYCTDGTSRSDVWVIIYAAHAKHFSYNQQSLNKENCFAQNRRSGQKTFSKQNNCLVQPVCVTERLINFHFLGHINNKQWGSGCGLRIDVTKYPCDL